MSWNNIIGQDRVKDILQRAILEKRISHSYCFWGTEGCGKDAIAIEFAKTANCERPIINGDSSIEACDECNSCHTISTLQNPNVQLLFSLPTPKSTSTKDESVLSKMSEEQISDIKEQLKLKAENPYHKISLAGANQIKIANVREIKKNLSMSAITAGRRFIIISNAHELTTEAANAFLKTLEEPHDEITIILTTPKIEQIMPTILSRSQQIHCEPIPDSEIVKILMDKYGKSSGEARIISAFAQGSYLRAMEYMDEDMQAFRESAVAAFRTTLKSKYRAELIKQLEPLVKAKDKKTTEKFLILLMLWLRDAIILKTTGNRELIINADYADTLQKFVDNFGQKDFPAAIEKIEIAISRIYKNVMTELILLDMFLDLRRILLRKS